MTYTEWAYWFMAKEILLLSYDRRELMDTELSWAKMSILWGNMRAAIFRWNSRLTSIKEIITLPVFPHDIGILASLTYTLSDGITMRIYQLTYAKILYIQGVNFGFLSRRLYYLSCKTYIPFALLLVWERADSEWQHFSRAGYKLISMY